MDWSEPVAIARELASRHPEVDPLAVRPPDLQRWVVELDGFIGEPRPPRPLDLEAVQRAWHRATTAE